jgi:RNA recognition motif-containing protein
MQCKHALVPSSFPCLRRWVGFSGDVVYTDVDRYGGGIVEFTTREDQEDAIRRLDDTEYKSKFDSSVSYLRVKKPKDQMTDEELDKEKDKDREIEERRASRRERSRSRSGRRERSASRSRSRSRLLACRALDL